MDAATKKRSRNCNGLFIAEDACSGYEFAHVADLCSCIVQPDTYKEGSHRERNLNPVLNRDGNVRVQRLNFDTSYINF